MFSNLNNKQALANCIKSTTIKKNAISEEIANVGAGGDAELKIYFARPNPR